MAFFETLAGAAAISGGANVAGGVIGNLINQNFQENEATRNQSNFNITQENFENATQIRVADAKKAGLHPLYAMGVNAPGPSGSQPVVLQDQIGPALQQSGQSVGNIMARSASADEKLKMNMEMDLARQQLLESDARIRSIDSEIARNNAAGQTGLGIQPEMGRSIAPEGQAPNAPGHSGEGMINKGPAAVTSQMTNRKDIIAGRDRAGFEVRTMGKNFPMIMPVAEGESPMELWSEMAWYDKVGLINRNVNEFGPGWFEDFVNVMYRGKDATGKYDSASLSKRKMKEYQSIKGMVIDPVSGHLISPKGGK